MLGSRLNIITAIVAALATVVIAGTEVFTVFIQAPKKDEVSTINNQKNSVSNNIEDKSVESSVKNIDIVTAKGIGVINMDIENEYQRIYLAKRAAKVDALRKLAESIHGNMISGRTIQKKRSTSYG